MHQVADVDAAYQHEIVGKQATMATPPHRLAAHHRQDSLVGEGQQLVDAGQEGVGLHVVGVGAERVVAQCHMLRAGARTAATAQFAHPGIVEPRLGNPPLHRFTTELRVVATAREGPHIDDATDLRAVEQRRERLGGERAVPDRSQRGHRGSPRPQACASEPPAVGIVIHVTLRT